jgi:hypothetical protein
MKTGELNTFGAAPMVSPRQAILDYDESHYTALRLKNVGDFVEIISFKRKC